MISHAVRKIFIALFVIAGTVVGNILTLGIPSFVSLYSNYNKKGVKEEIECRRIDHLYTALFCSLQGTDKWKVLNEEVPESALTGNLLNPDKDTLFFINEVKDLRMSISKLHDSRVEKEIDLDSVEGVYKKFQHLANNIRFMSVYRSLEPSDHPAVNFLKVLSAKFRSAEMTDLLIDHAKEKLGVVTPDQAAGYSIAKTGDALAGFRKEPSFAQNFFWAISHPTNWFHSCESKWLQKKYDSHESNPTYTVQEVEYTTKNQKTITARFTAGPTPFNDAAYQNIFLSNGHELRFNIMDTAKAEEHGWVTKMAQVANDSNGHLEHVVLGFVTKEKRGYLDATELDPLIDGYQEALLAGNASRTIQDRKIDNGVMIPNHLLSDPQIQSACSHAKALVKGLKPDLSKKEARHAVLVAVDTMMALGTMINYLEGVKDLTEDKSVDEDMRAVYIAIACKQCYDRGPVYVAALQLFFRSLSQDTPLSSNEFYQIAGLPLFRAPLGEGREQQEKKFAVYEAFAKMLGSNTALLSKHTRAFRSSLNE